VLPTHERPDDGAKPTWAEISSWARRGEELGVDPVWLVTAGVLYWRHRSAISWAIPIPVGIGMHITHTRRDRSDVIVGSIAEAALWTLIGIFAAPI
jgi:hypothetical protein